VGDASQQNFEVDESWDSPSEEGESLYGTSPPYNSRQMKRVSGKHQKSSQSRSSGRSPNKGKLIYQLGRGVYGNLALHWLFVCLLQRTSAHLPRERVPSQYRPLRRTATGRARSRGPHSALPRETRRRPFMLKQELSCWIHSQSQVILVPLTWIQGNIT